MRKAVLTCQEGRLATPWLLLPAQEDPQLSGEWGGRDGMWGQRGSVGVERVWGGAG